MNDNPPNSQNVLLELEKMNKKKIRVAICLSGQPRFYNSKSYETIKKQLLDVYNCDVYAHLWLSNDINFNYPYSPHLSCFKEIKMEPEKVKKELIELYSPVSCIFEEPREFKEFLLKGDERYAIKNFPSMFYSVWQSDLARREIGRQYDYVVRCRTDTLLNTFPDLTKLEKGVLYIPDNCP